MEPASTLPGSSGHPVGDERPISVGLGVGGGGGPASRAATALCFALIGGRQLKQLMRDWLALAGWRREDVV